MSETKTDTFKVTIYYPVTLEDPASWKEYPRGSDLPVSAVGLGKRNWPEGFLRAVRMEGSALAESRSISYDQGNYVSHDATKFPYGLNGIGRGLEPFRSVAVDPAVVRERSILHVESLRGVKMPNGTLHDGWVYACDTGGGIKGLHFDFFVRSHSDYLHLANQSNFPQTATVVYEPAS